MPTGLRPVVPTIGASLVAGCSFVTTTIRDRTDAIGGTSAAIAANTAVVQTSTGGRVTCLAVRPAILSAGRAAAPR